MKTLLTLVAITCCFYCSSQTNFRSEPFKKSEIASAKGMVQVYSSERNITDDSPIIFATDDENGYMKVKGKLIALKSVGGMDTDSSTVDGYVGDKFNVALEILSAKNANWITVKEKNGIMLLRQRLFSDKKFEDSSSEKKKKISSEVQQF